MDKQYIYDFTNSITLLNNASFGVDIASFISLLLSNELGLASDHYWNPLVFAQRLYDEYQENSGEAQPEGAPKAGQTDEAMMIDGEDYLDELGLDMDFLELTTEEAGKSGKRALTVLLTFSHVGVVNKANMDKLKTIFLRPSDETSEQKMRLFESLGALATEAERAGMADVALDLDMLIFVLEKTGENRTHAIWSLQQFINSIRENYIEKKIFDKGLIKAIAENAKESASLVYDALTKMVFSVDLNKSNTNVLDIELLKAIAVNAKEDAKKVYKQLADMSSGKDVHKDAAKEMLVVPEILMALAQIEGEKMSKTFSAFTRFVKAGIRDDSDIPKMKDLLLTIAQKAKEDADEAYPALGACIMTGLMSKHSIDKTKILFTAIGENAGTKKGLAYRDLRR